MISITFLIPTTISLIHNHSKNPQSMNAPLIFSEFFVLFIINRINIMACNNVLSFIFNSFQENKRKKWENSREKKENRGASINYNSFWVFHENSCFSKRHNS
jgi:hypothetical protein